MRVGEILKRLGEVFWLRERLAVSRREAFTSEQAGFKEFALGRITLVQGDFLRSAGGKLSPAALAYRTSARLMIRASLLRAGHASESVDAVAASWERLTGLVPVAAPEGGLAKEQLELLPASLGAEGESFVAQLPPAQAERAALELRQLAKRVGAPLEASAGGVYGVLVARWLRIGLGLLLLALVSGAVFFGAESLTGGSGPNLALHRAVIVQHPHGVFGKDPSRLVDGDRTNLGFHTARRRSGSVTIDLGSPQLISRVSVYNRVDCCRDRAVPIQLEIAEGTVFREIAARKETFDVWDVELPPEMARYVRLTNTNRKGLFHLSEVEVY